MKFWNKPKKRYREITVSHARYRYIVETQNSTYALSTLDKAVEQNVYHVEKGTCMRVYLAHLKRDEPMLVFLASSGCDGDDITTSAVREIRDLFDEEEILPLALAWAV